VPRVWEEQGLPDFDGVVWYRRRVSLTAEQAAGAATLHLGTVDDCDESFVNGQRVGGDCFWNVARHHPVPAGLLHEGDNLIAVRVTDTGGPGGFYGDAAAVRLETQAGDLPLSGRWRARVESPLLRTQPGVNDAPTLLFNAMVQPLLPLRIRGVLWYQGESNVARAARYAGAFQRLIRDWRTQWGEGDFPFYFVQLASYLPPEKNPASGSEWAELRDAQRLALKLPNTGMVVTTDIGDAKDIHPRNKQAVGDRLAGIALHDLHGRRAIVSRGPDYRAMRRVGAAIELRFSNTGRGLAARGGDVAALQGFAIADASHRFRPARATVRGDRVVVASDEVAQPVAVRYGWVDNPEQANLINREGLPASPFRTDDWPVMTEGGRFRP
jgi:sialate O-acetylesterase